MRKLTEKEKQRKEYFDKIREKMKADGYDKIDLTVGVVKANVVALFLPPSICSVGMYCLFSCKSYRSRSCRYQLRHLGDPLYVFSGAYYFDSTS